MLNSKKVFTGKLGKSQQEDKEVYDYFKKCNYEDMFDFIVMLETAMLCGFIDDSPSLSIFQEFINNYINNIS